MATSTWRRVNAVCDLVCEHLAALGLDAPRHGVKRFQSVARRARARRLADRGSAHHSDASSSAGGGGWRLARLGAGEQAQVDGWTRAGRPHASVRGIYHFPWPRSRVHRSYQALSSSGSALWSVTTFSSLSKNKKPYPMLGSNQRPPACKAIALTTWPIGHPMSELVDFVHHVLCTM